MGGVTLKCYDFGGQEVFYPTHEFFLSSRALYLVVVNLAALNVRSLSYWLNKIATYAGRQRPPVLIVGTNLDRVALDQIPSLQVDSMCVCMWCVCECMWCVCVDVCAH